VDAIDGVDDQGRLRVRVRVAPADGAANAAVLKVLATALGVRGSGVALVSGAASRVKRITVEAPADALRQRWPGLLTREE
jgi:uncharacterized protein YggU (UPF0235/DUF167 family)